MEKKEYDLNHESEGQMLLRIAKRFIILFIIILMFDVILDFFSAILDYILGFIHLIIEFFEYSFELLLEHFLHAKHYESEIITANFVLLIALYIILRLSFKLPRLHIWMTRRIKATWLRTKRKQKSYWKALPTIRKVEIIISYTIGIFCILFLLTL